VAPRWNLCGLSWTYELTTNFASIAGTNGRPFNVPTESIVSKKGDPSADQNAEYNAVNQKSVMY